MKKFFLFALVATLFAACSTDATQDLAPEIPTAPNELHVSFDEETSRIQLGENGTPVWTEGDLVSVFYRSNAHDKYQFTGETGDTGGTLKRVSQSTPTMGLDKVIAVYPYNENYLLSPLSGNIKALLPAEQTYLANSYGIGSSLMVSSSQTDRIYLKNVCGWLKLQFTGEGTIEKIVLRGNNGEQVAGDIYICSDDASCTLASDLTGADGTNSGDLEGALVGTNTILTEVTLNCNGVALNTETPTAFYIALPPQTFDDGISIIAMCDDGTIRTKSTESTLTIERNHIVPMATLDTRTLQTQSTPAPYVIWYTSADGNIITPYQSGKSYFGAKIISNTYKNGRGVIKFDGDVTLIGEKVFYSRSRLKSIIIPNSVMEIGMEAFYDCKALTGMTIPNGVAKIGKNAFSNCTGELIINCNIPSASDSYNSVFYGSKFTSATIGDSVTSIGDYAFYYCSALKSVHISDSVTSIGDWAFASCSALKSINIPNSVTKIGERAFSNCSGAIIINCNIPSASKSDEGVFYGSKFTSATIGDSVTSIGDYAFYDCSALTSVNISNSVTSIGKGAFYSCDALTSVIIGNGITIIGVGAFNNCDSITSVYISNLSAWCKIDFSSVSANPLDNNNAKLYLDGELVTDLTIPSDITILKPFVFKGCNSVTRVIIPDSVTSIEDKAFTSCFVLENITIGNGVTMIGNYAFDNCTALKEVYCKPTTPPTVGSDMLRDNTAGRKIYVPTESVDAYKTTSGWSDYASSIEPYNFTE